MSEYEIRSAIDILNKSNIISLDDTVITPAGGINPEKDIIDKFKYGGTWGYYKKLTVMRKRNCFCVSMMDT